MNNKIKKQFAVVVGNPPYQTKSNKNFTKTQAIWPEFVKLSFKLCKENGYVSLVHPSGWRGIENYKKTFDIINSNQMQYLEIHDEKDGIKIFNAETRYDWYVSKKCQPYEKTIIKDQKGNIIKIDISKVGFIPNCDFKLFYKLFAKDGEERVKIIHSFSDYETRKPYMSKTQTKRFKYPCIYIVNSKGELKLFYSSQKKGHFDIPKLVFSNGRISSANYFIDKKGEYALTQFSYGVVDEPNNLDNIYKAMRTKNFKSLMESCSVGMLGINRYAISLFRKDFWKEFI